VFWGVDRGRCPQTPAGGWPLAKASGARRVGVAAARQTRTCYLGPPPSKHHALHALMQPGG
jgi:hypothetical protein